MRLLSLKNIRLFAALALFCFSINAVALSLSNYAETSVLASGRWVKISVPSSGIYAISRASLSKWGFSDPSKVHVYGYGAANIEDALTQANYTDDLPLLQTELTSDGSIVFYGVGPEKWSESVSGRFVSKNNIYTTKGYYYLSDVDVDAAVFGEVGTAAVASNNVTTFTERLQHETDDTSIGETGGELVGEDFRYTPSRTFTFNLPGRVEDDGSVLWMECSFAAYTTSTNSQLAFTANGAAVTSNSNDRIAATVSSSSNEVYASSTTTRHDLTASGNTLTLGIKHSSSGTISGAWLNYIAINYTRALSLADTDGYLEFTLKTGFTLSGASSDTRVWDVTSPQNILVANVTEVSNGSVSYTSPYYTWHNYVAWSPSAKMPEPTYEGVVSNQNLHGLAGTEMVIFTPSAWASQAERIAALHRAEGLDVTVVDVEAVYNEFGSGSAHVGALRRYLKMLYDRGKSGDLQLKYALLMGRGTYDNRHLTSAMKNSAPTLPMWYSSTLRQSMSDNDGYGTDDFLAMLEDGSGSSFGMDLLSVAVGRIPVTSLAVATNYVDKLEQYINKSKTGVWRNNLLLLADDADSSSHMQQTENFANAIQSTENQQFLINKVYIDAYERTNGNYPQAREEMFRLLDEGTLWWNYVGHANSHSWTHEGQLTYNDINNMYLNRVPILYAATCNFLRWDSETESGGEILLNERYGGNIAIISATRPVYIYYNGLLTASMGRYFATREDDGSFHRLGEIYRLAKNDIRDLDKSTYLPKGSRISDTNRLRYVLVGDPALRLLTPSNVVRLDAVNGMSVGGDNQPTVAARQSATFEGSVTDANGNLLSDFNGYVNATIYDAETSTTTNGNDSGESTGDPFTFDHHGSRLFAGSTLVKDGKFSLQVNMPSEISDNFRPALINMYALTDDSSIDAIGVNSEFYVYGFDDAEPEDTEAPEIKSFYLNHSSFRDGDTVNDEPMAIAEVSDNKGINLSLAGIGHQMILTLDDKTTYSDVAQYYTPATDGSYSGVINYPVSALEAGEHKLALRVWDVDGNSETATINFVVSENIAPKIYEIWTDSNPASTQANFYISHDRPDQMATVSVTVYNLLGHALWTKTVRGMSDMFTSTPVTWDLCDAAGRRVQRGIYLYRATITCDGETYDTASKRIAVTN